jgi:hypothetical protein
MRILRKLFLSLFFIFLAFVLFAIGYYFAVTANVQLSHEKLMLVDQNVFLYDAYQQPIDDFLHLSKQPVSIEDVPKIT